MLYSDRENSPAGQRGDIQVVLVTAQSIKDIEKTYPNYFNNIREFTQKLKKFS